MALTSSSTLTQIIAAVVDNASYEEDDDITKAKAFVTACRILIFKLPAEQSNRVATTKFSIADLRKMKSEADAWLEKKGSGTSYSNKIVHPSFADFRG